MKRIYLLTLICFGMLLVSKGQYVDRIYFNVDEPDNSTFIKITSHTIFNKSNSRLINDSVIIIGNNIDVYGSFSTENGSKPSLSIDTFPIGILSAGSYRLIINCKVNNGHFLASDTSFFIVEKCFATENPETNAPELKLYPNPVINDLFIDYNLPTCESGTIIHIFNIIGEEIDRLGISDKSGKLRINTSDYEPGLYIIKMVQKNHEIFTRKFKVVA